MERGKKSNTSLNGIALIVSGPSGVGKSTLLKALRERYEGVDFSVSCTTRQPRQGEQHGVDYYFVTPETFAEHLANGEFLEHAKVFANSYGTLKSEVINRVNRGEEVLLDIDVQGAMQIRAQAAIDPALAACCRFVFIAPPSLNELERRLRGRSTDSEEQISLRLAQAKEELSYWSKYDYVIINDQISEAQADFLGLFAALRLDSKRLAEDRFND